MLLNSLFLQSQFAWKSVLHRFNTSLYQNKKIHEFCMRPTVWVFSTKQAGTRGLVDPGCKICISRRISLAWLLFSLWACGVWCAWAIHASNIFKKQPQLLHGCTFYWARAQSNERAREASRRSICENEKSTTGSTLACCLPVSLFVFLRALWKSNALLQTTQALQITGGAAEVCGGYCCLKSFGEGISLRKQRICKQLAKLCMGCFQNCEDFNFSQALLRTLWFYCVLALLITIRTLRNIMNWFMYFFASHVSSNKHAVKLFSFCCVLSNHHSLISIFYMIGSSLHVQTNDKEMDLSLCKL